MHLCLFAVPQTAVAEVRATIDLAHFSNHATLLCPPGRVVGMEGAHVFFFNYKRPIAEMDSKLTKCDQTFTPVHTLTVCVFSSEEECSPIKRDTWRG